METLHRSLVVNCDGDGDLPIKHQSYLTNLVSIDSELNKDSKNGFNSPLKLLGFARKSPNCGDDVICQRVHTQRLNDSFESRSWAY